MNQINAHKTGLVLGGLFGTVHAVWALMVFMGIAKPFLDFILGLHFLTFDYSINPFSLVSALMLVLMTVILGYLAGYVFGRFWNIAHQEKQ